MPHILIPIHDFNAGGTEAVAFRLAAEWLARGWRVTVMAGDGAGPMRARVPDGAAVHVLWPPIPRSTVSRLKLSAALAAEAKAHAPDLIFIVGNFHFVLAHAFKRALPQVPVVAKISNPLLGQGAVIQAMARLGRLLLRRYFAPIDRMVAMTAGQRDELLRLVPDAVASVIADPNVKDAALVPAMRDRRQGHGAIRLLLVGRLEPQKDIPLALEVLTVLNRSQPAHLTVLGEGYLRPQIEAQAARLGLKDQLSLPGFSNDIAAACRAADLLLITSRYEGGPGIAVEALAEALPLVSTDCSHFLREIISDPRLGRIVVGRDPQTIANAIIAQMAEPPAPPELLEQTLAPSRFSVAADAYLQVFEAALGSRSA